MQPNLHLSADWQLQSEKVAEACRLSIIKSLNGWTGYLGADIISGSHRQEKTLRGNKKRRRRRRRKRLLAQWRATRTRTANKNRNSVEGKSNNSAICGLAGGIWTEFSALGSASSCLLLSDTVYSRPQIIILSAASPGHGDGDTNSDPTNPATRPNGQNTSQVKVGAVVQHQQTERLTCRTQSV